MTNDNSQINVVEINENKQIDVVEINENKLVIAASIIPFSIAGTLIRLAIMQLEDYPGMPVFSLVYVQWIGCLIMGIAAKNKNLLFLW